MITVQFQRLRRPAHSRALDIGCGSGRHSAALCDRGPGLVVGADTGLDDLRAAAEREALHARLRDTPGGTFCAAAADITNLPFADQSFALVICSEVLEHIADHERAAAELQRVLLYGGQLVVSVPRRWPEALCWALAADYRHAPGGHVRIYTAAALIALIERHGMVHRRTHHAHGWHTPYWILKCLLGLKREEAWPLRLYHRFLTWEMFSKPRTVRFLERLLNPLAGKSVVLYFDRPPAR